VQAGVFSAAALIPLRLDGKILRTECANPIWCVALKGWNTLKSNFEPAGVRARGLLSRCEPLPIARPDDLLPSRHG
jgi:hypothetical protein